jgi:hypothetical protein
VGAMNSPPHASCSFCGSDERAVHRLYTSRIADSTICDRCIREMACSLSREIGHADRSSANYRGWSWVIAVLPLVFLTWFGLIFTGPGSRSNLAQVLAGLYVVVYGTFEIGKRLARATFNADRIAPLSWLLTGVFFGLRVDQIGMVFGGLIALILWAGCYLGLRKYGALNRART